MALRKGDTVRRKTGSQMPIGKIDKIIKSEADPKNPIAVVKLYNNKLLEIKASLLVKVTPPREILKNYKPQ